MFQLGCLWKEALRQVQCTWCLLGQVRGMSIQKARGRKQDWQVEKSGPRMVQANPKRGPSPLPGWAIGQVFFPSASSVTHWLWEGHDLWEGRELRWWLFAAVDVEGALLGTGLPPKGGYGLLISVFIIKDKLKLGAWSLVIMDVSVVPQAYMASYSLAPPQIRA